jgi:hypothetical protein
MSLAQNNLTRIGTVLIWPFTISNYSKSKLLL